jgi:hypothetical protein
MVENMGEVKKYRKKPIVIEALQWTGKNIDDIFLFINTVDINIIKSWDSRELTITINTLEGDHIASVGDYIIKGIANEFYPCKPDIFKKTYEKVNE